MTLATNQTKQEVIISNLYIVLTQTCKNQMWEKWYQFYCRLYKKVFLYLHLHVKHALFCLLIPIFSAVKVSNCEEFLSPTFENFQFPKSTKCLQFLFSFFCIFSSYYFPHNIGYKILLFSFIQSLFSCSWHRYATFTFRCCLLQNV